jgi:hypothetical protein
MSYHEVYGVCTNESRVYEFQPFVETLDFFEDALEKRVVLAGGCIRDMWLEGEALIRDIDAWVLDVRESEVQTLDQMLGDAYREVVEVPTPELNNARAAETARSGDYPVHGQPFHVPRMNMYLPWITKPVQLMYTPEVSLRALIDKFDFHACSFGFDGETVISEGASDFEKHALSLNPQNALRSARSTLRRGFRFEDKFRGTPHYLKFPNDLILALASMLVLNGESENPKKA